MTAESLLLGLADRLRNLEAKWDVNEAANLRQWLEQGNLDVIKSHLIAYLNSPHEQSILQPIKRPTGLEMTITPKIVGSRKEYKDFEVETTTTIPELRQVFSKAVGIPASELEKFTWAFQRNDRRPYKETDVVGEYAGGIKTLEAELQEYKLPIHFGPLEIYVTVDYLTKVGPIRDNLINSPDIQAENPYQIVISLNGQPLRDSDAIVPLIRSTKNPIVTATVVSPEEGDRIQAAEEAVAEEED
jgi:hypothetical protein